MKGLLFAAYIGIFAMSTAACHEQSKSPARLQPGDPANGGLFLPDDFTAVVVADSIGPARHLAVNSNGDIYVRLQFSNGRGGMNVALRDTSDDGKADIIKVFGDEDDTLGYGTSMRIYNGYLYSSSMKAVYRNKLIPGKLLPDPKTELIFHHESKQAIFWHMAKPLAFDDKGHMFMPFGVPSNACEVLSQAGKPGVKGMKPCPELENSGGIWEFDANKTGQTQKDGQKYATGIRSIVAMGWNSDDKNLYVAMHGRDELNKLFPDYYSLWQSTVLPAEEFLKITQGSDAGWPYYYYDQIKRKKMLAPEYGGDGSKEGTGSRLLQPLVGFPGHWAPNDLIFYHGDQFPEHYKHGAFVAFHGSAVRAPYPQAGFFVAFVPFNNGQPSGDWEVFADGFTGVDTVVNISDAIYRPMGLAVGPDGSLYISDSNKGKIWKIMYKGNRQNFGRAQLATMQKRKTTQSYIRTPEEKLDNLNSNKKVTTGAAIYKNYCGECHQQNGRGDASRFPPLNGSEWVDGDKKELIRILLKGLAGPIKVKGKTYNVLMTPFNQLTNKEIAEVLTYVRQSFGNHSGAIDIHEVEKLRTNSK